MVTEKDLEKENKELKEELKKWKESAKKGELKPCGDIHLQNIQDYSDMPDRLYCSDPAHRFDPRCIKTLGKNPVTKHLESVLDADSPYYNEKSAKCLFGATGIDYKVEKRVEKKVEKKEKKD